MHSEEIARKTSLKLLSELRQEQKLIPVRLIPSVFQDSLGRCTKMKAKLILKQNVEPVFRPKRPK